MLDLAFHSNAVSAKTGKPSTFTLKFTTSFQRLAFRIAGNSVFSMVAAPFDARKTPAGAGGVYAERPILEPNHRNSLKFKTPRGLQFTLGLQFGYRDLRGIFAKTHRNSLGFTAIWEFLKSAGFEPKTGQNTVCLITRPHPQVNRANAIEGGIVQIPCS